MRGLPFRCVIRMRHRCASVGFASACSCAVPSIAAQAANQPAQIADRGGTPGGRRRLRAGPRSRSRRLATADEVQLPGTHLDRAGAPPPLMASSIDGTELAIGEQARVRLDEFVFDRRRRRQAWRCGSACEFGAALRPPARWPKPAYRINDADARALAVRGTEFDLAVDAPTAPTYLSWCASGAVREIRGGNGESRRGRRPGRR